jgi:4-phospho-D-threonate 3-dehydrogenase / 4-phospho-D-erythronate 3-dehydrogenase
MSPDLPLLGVTLGDPNGIGPEITVRAVLDPRVRTLARCLVIGDTWVIQEAATRFGAGALVHGGADAPRDRGVIWALDVGSLPPPLTPGKVTANGGQAAFKYIEVATRLAMEGRTQGVVTPPINKEALNLAGHHYAGHTELLAALTGSRETFMMLIGDALRVGHVTTHLPLRSVPERITQARVEGVILMMADALKRLGITRPRIGVAGLNPHAGEHGLFGDEDERVIAPAVRTAAASGVDASGPWPGDTIFPRALAGELDGVVVMYHDQGHIPVKLLSFQLGPGRTVGGVNVTLGLPIIRTSVEHGTAFDIAWTGRASPQSLVDAITLAAKLAESSPLPPQGSSRPRS